LQLSGQIIAQSDLLPDVGTALGPLRGEAEKRNGSHPNFGA
jgi:hypothetical protein